jgi:hypothetical protein
MIALFLIFLIFRFEYQQVIWTKELAVQMACEIGLGIEFFAIDSIFVYLFYNISVNISSILSMVQSLICC